MENNSRETSSKKAGSTNSRLQSFLAGIILGALLGGIIFMGFSSSEDDQTSQISASTCDLSLNSEGSEVENSGIMQEAAAYLKFKEIKNSYIPSGVPAVYGQELDISFDEVQDAIDKTRIFGPTYGVDGKKIALTDLTEAELERYKEVGASIACEYCCGVKTLTREDGTAACGCAHSVMMRGLAAYLIKNHPQEFTNEEILEELTKWKITYFPKQTLTAELSRLIEAGEPGIEQILKEFPDFLPQMVGGC